MRKFQIEDNKLQKFKCIYQVHLKGSGYPACDKELYLVSKCQMGEIM
jgi:hypothetical protein